MFKYMSKFEEIEFEKPRKSLWFFNYYFYNQNILIIFNNLIDNKNLFEQYIINIVVVAVTYFNKTSALINMFDKNCGGKNVW